MKSNTCKLESGPDRTGRAFRWSRSGRNKVEVVLLEKFDKKTERT